MRTPEQIIDDCEKAFKAIEEEAKRRAADPKIQRPCETCRWFSHIDTKGHEWSVESYIQKYGTCINPLVKGHEKYGVPYQQNPMPCGPEKALWEEKNLPKIWWPALLVLIPVFLIVGYILGPFFLG